MQRRASPFDGFRKLGRRGEGAPPAPPAAPVLTLDSYSGDDLTISNDKAGTGYWKWSASATPLTGAAIEAAPDGTASFPVGIIAQTIADPGPGTWYLNIVNKNAGGYSNVITVEEIVPAPGWTFLEDWSAYVVGNTWTQLDAAYSRTSTPNTTIAANANGPAGKSCIINTAGLGTRVIWRDDIAAQLALRTTERVQFLFKIQFTSLANSRNAVGMISGNLVWGAHIWRSGGGQNIAYTEGGDYTSAGAPKTDIATLQTDGDVFYIRIEIDGNDIRGRCWEPPAPEGAWGAPLTDASPIVVTNCSMGVRIVGDGLEVLGYSVGIINDAPMF